MKTLPSIKRPKRKNKKIEKVIKNITQKCDPELTRYIEEQIMSLFKPRGANKSHINKIDQELIDLINQAQSKKDKSGIMPRVSMSISKSEQEGFHKAMDDLLFKSESAVARYFTLIGMKTKGYIK